MADHTTEPQEDLETHDPDTPRGWIDQIEAEVRETSESDPYMLIVAAANGLNEAIGTATGLNAEGTLEDRLAALRTLGVSAETVDAARTIFENQNAMYRGKFDFNEKAAADIREACLILIGAIRDRLEE